MAEKNPLLHGNLEVRIINEDNQVKERGIFFQYSKKDGQIDKVDNKSVEVIISPINRTAGFAAIYRNFNDSAGELSLRISVAHHLSQVRIKISNLLTRCILNLLCLMCIEQAKFNLMITNAGRV